MSVVSDIKAALEKTFAMTLIIMYNVKSVAFSDPQKHMDQSHYYSAAV